MWVNLGEIGVDSLGRDKRTNVVDDDGNGFVDDVFGIDAQTRVGQTIIGLNDDNGHGTHCAGIIGAVGGNGVGISGVAPQVRIMSLKFLGKTGSGFFSDAVVALDYARLMGAHVTSNSYGYSGGGRPMSMDAAVQRLNTAGVAFVAAAGNDNSNNDLVPFWPASMGRPNVLSVATMAPDGNRAGFSNFGAASVHVAAPGVNILSTWASGDASYAWLSGTSMAAPFVAGQLALLRAHLPSAPMNDLIGRVKDIALPMAEWSGIVVSGGRIQVSDSLTRGAPVILSQPEAASGRLGGTVELSVVAEGYDGFQWRKNGEIIPGAVTDRLVFANLSLGDFGSYDVLVRNGDASVSSRAVVVGVYGTDRDYNGDGQSDLLVQNTRTWQISAPLMDGAEVMSQVLLAGPTGTGGCRARLTLMEIVSRILSSSTRAPDAG